MSVRSNLTRRLIEALKDQGNGVTGMASLCGVSRRTIYDWLEKDQGAQNHHLEVLVKLTGFELTDAEKRLLQRGHDESY